MKPAKRDLIDRQPPFDLQAESGVLASALMMPSCLDEVNLRIGPEDFFDPAHAALFAGILWLQRNDKAIDLTLLADRLKVCGKWEAVGGVSGLKRVADSVATPAHAIYYAEIVREKAALRGIITVATRAISQAFDGLPSGDVADALAGSLDMQTRHNEEVIETIGVTARRVVAELDTPVAMKQCLFTGISGLDADTTLLMPGELVVLAARPGNGKTSMAQQIARHNAENGRSVLFCSIEMAADEVARRELCAETGITEDTLRRQSASSQQLAELKRAADGLDGLPLKIYRPRRRPTIHQMAAAARAVKRREGLDLLIVDYIGLVRPNDSRMQRYEQVTQIVGDLKQLAVSLGVPLLTLCQLNREAANARPTLAMLRESGAIEQDADAVLLLHRDAGDQVLLIVAKNRHGPTGEHWLRFDGSRTRFERGVPEQQSSQRRSRFQKKTA